MPEDVEKPHHLGHRQRLRDRFMAGGAEPMPDYELLELLLTHAIPRRDVKPIAKDLIARFGNFAGVISADPKSLAESKFIGDNAVVLIKLVREAALRLAKQDVINRPILSSWDRLLDYCQAAMAYGDTEQFRLLFLDRKNVLIADEVQQKGTVDHTPVYPREVVKRALELGASAIIMVHNHPSGDTTPSRADIEMTRMVRDALKPVGIALHDHLIVGRGRHTSFKSEGLL
ncbi:DNA repair protein RadC [Telmatospirillum sp. J64-1]|uniref:RadC family protein n=1 Tax=Telmatospirillum sp. J64-1 TaxID=2502183 RepID=UPI0021070427|nr:DNA repair protein RadC [Telmatospirillum sp. J64-1]